MHRLAGVDAAARRIERPRRLVRQEHVDVRERLAGQHLVAHEVPALVVAALAQLHRRARRPGGRATAAARRRGVWYQLGANVPPSAATRHGPTTCGPPFGR